MRETWYLLPDGSAVDPAECTSDDAGWPVHATGGPVAARGNVPSTRSVVPDEERATYATREATAGKPGRGYKTRKVD
jgi:hypothetical protein